MPAPNFTSLSDDEIVLVEQAQKNLERRLLKSGRLVMVAVAVPVSIWMFSEVVSPSSPSEGPDFLPALLMLGAVALFAFGAIMAALDYRAHLIRADAVAELSRRGRLDLSEHAVVERPDRASVRRMLVPGVAFVASGLALLVVVAFMVLGPPASAESTATVALWLLGLVMVCFVWLLVAVVFVYRAGRVGPSTSR